MYLCYTYMFMWVVPVCICLGEPEVVNQCLSPSLYLYSRAVTGPLTPLEAQWFRLAVIVSSASCLHFPVLDCRHVPHGPPFPWGLGTEIPMGTYYPEPSPWPLFLGLIGGTLFGDPPKIRKRQKTFFFPLPYPLFLSKTVTLVLSMSNRFCSIRYSPEGK